MSPLGKRSQVCGYLGRELDGQGTSIKAEWATSHGYVMLITSAKSQSIRGASHQPAFMADCLTISHMCLPCLPSGKVNPCVPGVIEGSEDI